MTREDDVNALIKSVLECILDSYGNPNGGFVYTCPLCGKSKEVSGENAFNMKTFPHDVNCGYLIAKGLAINLKLTDDT